MYFGLVTLHQVSSKQLSTSPALLPLLTLLICPRNFYHYFDAVEKYMPRNCSADVQALVAHVDEVFTSGTPAEQKTLKKRLGMEGVEHLDDVAAARKLPAAA